MLLRFARLTLTLLLPGAVSGAQQGTTGSPSLQRQYKEGAVSHYTMTGDNDGWRYTVQTAVVVKRDHTGRFYEELRWSDFSSNAEQTLAPESLALRQTVSLDDPVSYMKVPNLAQVQSFLIGPITDTLTFYSDLLLTMQAGLLHPGQTAYVPRTTPNSWADGQRVLIGEDVVDFSLRVEAVNPADHTETILVQHVPPPQSHVQRPAPWMQQTSTATPTNFVQVSKEGDNYIAETGKEAFDVRLTIDTRDGHLLSATMHNPVELGIRTCTDKALQHCGPATHKTTLREITWIQLP